MSDKIISGNAIVIERIFDAPIDLIWQMWTQAEHFKNWYGPEGFVTPLAQIDLRLGGKRLFRMETPDGSMTMWLAGEYTEIVPKTRLAYTESMADENGNLLSENEGEPPMVTIITVLLEDLGGRTKMQMTHAGLPADDGASEGWKQALTKMADYAETLLNEQ